MSMTREEAEKTFKDLVRRYGLQWTATVPREAWDKMAEVNKHLTEEDRRRLLGLQP